MINKKIINVIKLVFIITLTISFNIIKTIDESFKESDIYRQIGINESKKELENDMELKENFFNPTYIDELLKNDTQLCFDFYKKKTEKKITKEDFDEELKNNKNDIKQFLIEESLEFLEKIIEKKFLKESPNQEASINLLEIETELPKIILKNEIPNIQNKFPSDLILPKILKIKKEEMKIKAAINNYYNEQNNKKNPVEKKQEMKTREVMNYIYSQPEDKQGKIIASLDFKLFESLRCGDVTPLTKYIEEVIHQLKNSSDDPDINPKEIENLRNEINNLKRKIDNLSSESKLNKTEIEHLRNLCNDIKTGQELRHEESKNKNATQNEIKTIIKKIEDLEKTNNQYLYLIITLGCSVICILYKQFFSSDEN
jgi:hypothetical protein